VIQARDRAELEWFTEGSTEYFANLALIRSEQVSTTDFLQKVAVNVGQYEYFLNSGLFRDVTIAGAGQSKGNNRFGVYASGWVMAFMLDQELRGASAGQQSLESVMRALLKSASAGPVTIEGLLDSVADIGGQELSGRLRAAVTTRTPVDLAPYFAGLGLKLAGQDYAGEYYVRLDAIADRKAVQRRKAWAGF
jgi:predicted metalloprotease with PDZ domain